MHPICGVWSSLRRLLRRLSSLSLLSSGLNGGILFCSNARCPSPCPRLDIVSCAGSPIGSPFLHRRSLLHCSIDGSLFPGSFLISSLGFLCSLGLLCGPLCSLGFLCSNAGSCLLSSLLCNSCSFGPLSNNVGSLLLSSPLCSSGTPGAAATFIGEYASPFLAVQSTRYELSPAHGTPGAAATFLGEYTSPLLAV
uniref:Uncharacterized protein n=1 Tax=Eutreptiella gymnastica TaxID=73025 RepID=A0A7S1NMM1_9EUGL